MSSLGSDWQLVTSESDRLASDVRIYCDDGECISPTSFNSTFCRFFENMEQVWLIHIKIGAHFSTQGKKSSKIDPDNMLRTTVSCAKGVYAVTNLGRLQIPSDKPQQNPERCSITICDKQFKRMSKSGLSTLGNIPASKDLTKLPDGVKDLQGLISMVLLHEVGYLILT